MTVSIFRSKNDVSTAFNRGVLFALDRIKSGNSREIVDQIRALPKEKGDVLKAGLAGVCFNGSFRHRSLSGLIKHSGLMIIDLDGFDTMQQAIECRDSLREDVYIYSAWVSPSGKGVKALVKIPAEEENHKLRYRAFKTHLAHEGWDDSGSDVARFCFESYDPDLWINEESLLFTDMDKPDLEDIGTKKASIAIKSESRIVNNLVTWWQDKFGFNKGSRNTNLYKLAIAFNDFGVAQSVAKHILQDYKDVGFNQTEIDSIIKSAYSKTENFGTKEFEDNDSQQKIEKLIRTGKQADYITKQFPDFTKSEVDDFIENVKDTLDIDEFWYYDDKNKIRLSIHKFKFWLEQNNFFKYYPSANSDTYTFIRKEQNLLEETNEKHIKDFVLNYIISKPNIGYAPYDFMAGNGQYFRPDFLSMIDTQDVKIKEDTKTECYIYYKNCVVEITKNDVREIDYIDIDGNVWRNQIINREFKKADHHDAVYRKFVWLMSGQDVHKYNSFKSVIGYLMHSFKTSANNKAIVFNDETISENPNGRSGKGLFWNALKHMRNVARIDGKHFEFSKSFAFQTVREDSNILVFDDVKKNFNFENLFSVITEGITLEYKNQAAVQMPVEKSPKIIITTNYTLGGTGGSHEARKFEIEVSSYFSSSHTPLQEFGHMLFNDWDDEEWLRFDNYMINCEQYYLKNGLVSHDFNNLEVRKFIKETCYEFYQWTDEGAIKQGERLNKAMLFESILDEYPDLRKWLSQRTFTKWLRAYATYKGIKYDDGKSGSMRWFLLGEQQKFDNIADSSEAPF